MSKLNQRSYNINYKYQISSVTNCGLKRIGTLPFSMYRGTCFTNNEHIVLCFDYDDDKQCYRSTKPLGNFVKNAKSSYGHSWQRMTSSNSEHSAHHTNFDQNVSTIEYGFAVGGCDGCNAETELLRMADWTRERRTKYPFAKYIDSHASVMHDQMFYVFGGYGQIDEQGRDLSTIAQYNPDSDTWTKVGDLNTARRYHDAIVSQGAFLTVGRGPTEKCQLEGKSMVCVDQEPNMAYRYG